MSRYIKSNMYSEYSGEYLLNSATDFSDVDGASQHSSHPVNLSPLPLSLPMTRPLPLQGNPALYETWCANNNRPKGDSRPHHEKVHPENSGNASANEDKEQENYEARPEYRSRYDLDCTSLSRANEIGFPVVAHVSYHSVDPADSTCSTPSRGEIRIPLAICGQLMDVLGSRRPDAMSSDAMSSGVWQQGGVRQSEERQRIQRQRDEMPFDERPYYVERSGNGRQGNEWRTNERQINERQSNDIQSNAGQRNERQRNDIQSNAGQRNERQRNDIQSNAGQRNERQSNDIQSNAGQRNERQRNMRESHEQQIFGQSIKEQTHAHRRSNEWSGVEKDSTEEKSGEKQSGDNEQVYEWQSDEGHWGQGRKEQDGRRKTLEPPRQRLPEEQEVKRVPSAREQEVQRHPQKRKPGSVREKTPAAHQLRGFQSQLDLNSVLDSLERKIGMDISSTDTFSWSSTPRRRSPPTDASILTPAALIPRPPSESKERLFKAHLSEHVEVKESGDGEELKRGSGTEKEIQVKPRPPSSSKEHLYKAHLSQHLVKKENGDSEGSKRDVVQNRDTQKEVARKPAHDNQITQDPRVNVPNLDSTKAMEEIMSKAFVESILNNLHGDLPTPAERAKEITVIHEAPTKRQLCHVEMDPRQAYAIVHEQQTMLKRDLPSSPVEQRPFYGVASPRHRPGTARHNVPAEQQSRSHHKHRAVADTQMYSSVLGSTLNGKITDFDNQEMWDELYTTADRHTETETSDGDARSSLHASRSSRLKKGKKLLSTASIRYLNSKKNSSKRSFVKQTEKDLMQRIDGEDVVRFATTYISKLIEKTVDQKLAGRRKHVSRQVSESTSGSTVKLQDSSTKRKSIYKDELALHIVKSEIDRLDDEENPLTGRKRLQQLKKMQNGHLQHITREVEQLMAINWCLDDHDQMHPKQMSTSRKTTHREE